MSSDQEPKKPPDSAEHFVRRSTRSSGAKNWFDRFAANCAGAAWWIGDGILLWNGSVDKVCVQSATDAWHQSWLEVLNTGISGACNQAEGSVALIASAATMTAFGNRDSGYNVSLIFAQIGITLNAWDGMAAGTTGAWLGCLGYGLAVAVGLATNRLERDWRQNKHWHLRNSLGRPREAVGLGFALADIPLLCYAVQSGHSLSAVAFGILALGDVVEVFAKPERRQSRSQMQPKI